MATNAPDVNEVEDEKLPDEALYEVIDGRIVELPPMGTDQEITAGILHIRLGNHADTTKVGRAVVETLFDFTQQVGASVGRTWRLFPAAAGRVPSLWDRVTVGPWCLTWPLKSSVRPTPGTKCWRRFRSTFR